MNRSLALMSGTLPYSDLIGKESEDRIEKIFRRLWRVNVIKYYARAKPLDALDKRKVDFVVCITHHVPTPFQVKSSLYRKSIHMETDGDIPCVAVLHFQSDDELTLVVLHELGIPTEGVLEKIHELLARDPAA